MGGQQIKREPEGPPEAFFIRRPHPGYPLASCSSAALTSVSPEPLCILNSALAHFSNRGANMLGRYRLGLLQSGNIERDMRQQVDFAG